MPSEVSDRIASLLALFDEAIKAHDRNRAASILHDATHLDPQNVEVKARWLQLEDGQNDVLKLLRSSLTRPDDSAARKAVVEALGRRRLSASEASDAYDLITSQDEPPNLSIRDELLAVLLNEQDEVRSLLKRKLSSNSPNVYQQVFPIGDRAFNAVLAVALNDVSWDTEHAQKAAAAYRRELFQFCAVKLSESSGDQRQRAMLALARQLSAQPGQVADLINTDVAYCLLSGLDIRMPDVERSSSLLAASKMLEATKERGEQLFASFVLSNMQHGKVVLGFSAAAAMFPIIPATAARLFLTEGFVQSLVSSPRVVESAELSMASDNNFVEQAKLDLMSAACVDKACRDAIEMHCIDWLTARAESDDNVHFTSATLILAKLGKGSTDELTNKLSAIAVNDSRDGQHAIEGLAYASLQAKTKERICQDTALLESLLTTLKRRPESAFGCLTIFTNLTAYRQLQSEEQKKLAELKAYANASQAQTPLDPLDDDQHVTARCKKILDLGLVSALVASSRLYASSTNVALMVRILLSLAKEQRHRSKMAQQGAIRLLLQTHQRTSEIDSGKAEDDSKIRHNAAHALARLLISVNPAHVFTSAIPVTSAVSTLASLLAPDPEAEERDLLPIFEALLALTNLASMDDSAARDQIIRSNFDSVEDLLFSPNTMIQRATVELVCNLMASPTCVAKFADGSKDSKRRLLILLALTDVEDLATRRAAGGALAMLTEWDVAVVAVLDAKSGGSDQQRDEDEKAKGVKAVMRMCQDESMEVKHRGLACLQNLLAAPGEIGAKAVQMVKEGNGATAVREGLKGAKDAAVLAVGVDVLKRLV